MFSFVIQSIVRNSPGRIISVCFNKHRELYINYICQPHVDKKIIQMSTESSSSSSFVLNLNHWRAVHDR